MFAAKVRRSRTGGAQVGIRGQACSETTCKNIDVPVMLPAADVSSKGAPFDLTTLVRVR